MTGMLAQTDIAPWAEYGVAGLVIFAMFGVLIWLLRSHSSERKDLHKECRDERREMMEAHRAERDEWNNAQDRREGRSEALFKSLEQTIRDSSK